MALLHLTGAHLAYGHVPLLSDAAFSLDEGERIALIGRNGSGKSSLLRLLAGTEAPDAGLLNVQQGLRRAVVAQEPHFDDALTVFDAVAQGVQEARALRERVEQHVSGDDIDTVHARLDALDGWTWEQRVEEAIERLRLPHDAAVATLSGGTAKRVALARALVERPDVLLLDEPTNHLDIDAIEWLQSLLAAWRGALVVVSHDRAFIDAVATRIVELDRGTLRSYPGRFAAYEATKQRELEAEALATARADKLLAAEEVWVRQGVEARRTRSVGRVARLEALRAQRAARRDSLAHVRLELSAGRVSGRLVAELDDVSVSLGGRLLIDRFSGTFLRGDKVGLIGPNGVGKTTMLKLLLGELAPDRGRVRRGTHLSVAYFDQMRSALKLDATLADTISPGSEWVEIGRSRRHVMSYLGDFLFAPARAQALVSTLSGGERNRLLLARLFALPANVLVLDEPTNDLDIETLELLEELLQAYDGTVFLVSHDRRFLDAVVTSTLAWEGDAGTPGLWREYPGGYADWRVQRDRSRAAAAASTSMVAPGPAATAPSASAARNAVAPAKARAKLSFKEQRELDGLPGQIAALEAEQKAIGERLASTELYTDEPQRVGELQARYEQIDDALTEALTRWEALDARAKP